MARASRLNPTVMSRLFAELRRGSDIQKACAVAGIGRRTVYDWNDRGEAGLQPYATFRALFLSATAAGAKAIVLDAIASIENADRMSA